MSQARKAADQKIKTPRVLVWHFVQHTVFVCLMSIKLPVTEHVFPQSGAVFHCHQDSPIYCFCLTGREIERIAAQIGREAVIWKTQLHLTLARELVSINPVFIWKNASCVLFHWNIFWFCTFIVDPFLSCMRSKTLQCFEQVLRKLGLGIPLWAVLTS